MTNRVTLFCEDRGHEQFVCAMVQRIAHEVGVPVSLDTKSARGGSGRALTELAGWQRSLLLGRLSGTPDLLVIAIDGNCVGHATRHREIQAEVQTQVIPRTVIACPDPHVERWLIADPDAFSRAAETACPQDPTTKCERDYYKSLIGTALADAGIPVLTGVMEFAPDIVAEMDLYRAGTSQPSLGAFTDDLRAALRQLQSSVAPS